MIIDDGWQSVSGDPQDEKKGEQSEKKQEPLLRLTWCKWFYNELHSYLASAGVDGVKVDVQCILVCFVNLGTEACMGVLRLACAFIGKEKLIKFEGYFHGHANLFLVKAGSGVATLWLLDSPGGGPKATAYETLNAPFNDILAVENLFEMNKGEIAEIILEPVFVNSGFIVPRPNFLNAIRKLCKENGALVIFDEVMMDSVYHMV